MVISYVFIYMGSIYQIKNVITNDIYIGSALSFKKRKYYHIYDLKNKKHHSHILQNSWNKHGEDAFLFSIIEDVTNNSDLLIREQYWIDELNPRYNISKIAGSCFGVKHSPQSRLNMSISHKGKPLKEMGHKDNCECCICSRKDGVESPRYIKREIRYCKCGCGKQFEVIVTSNKKFVSGHNGPNKGKKKPKDAIETHRKKVSKPVLQFTLGNELINEWESIKIASEALKFYDSGIINNCKNRTKSFKNFIWKYK